MRLGNYKWTVCMKCGERYVINQCKRHYCKTTEGEAIRLLRNLADLQIDAPLESYRKEWESTMNEIYEFLNKHE